MPMDERLNLKLKYLESIADELIEDCKKQDAELKELMDVLLSIGKNPDDGWNYRLIHRVYPGGKEDLAIYEVYYTDDKPDSCTVDPVEPHGEDIKEFKECFEHYKSALFKPILQYDDFPDSEFQEW